MRFVHTALGVALALFMSTWCLAQDPDSRLCAIQGDPVAEAPFNLVDAFCIPSSSPLGPLGGPATIAGAGTFPANANGQLDVFIIWEPGQIASSPGDSFQYSSSLQWNSAQPDAVYKEWVGNFVPNPPQAFMITDSSNPDLTPTELALTDTSGVVTDRTFTHDEFPPVPLGRYHIQVTGLDPFEEVMFAKNGVGAHVQTVPEPAASLLLVGGVAVLTLSTRRQRRRG